jgi:hypothetical protein
VGLGGQRPDPLGGLLIDVHDLLRASPCTRLTNVHTRRGLPPKRSLARFPRTGGFERAGGSRRPGGVSRFR